MKIDADRIILGTAQLGLKYGIANCHGQPSLDEARKILDTASSRGIRRIDTAVAYGTSQETLGRIHNDRFELISKWSKSPAELSITLDLLRTETLETWMAHRSEALLSDPNLWRSMQQQKDLGSVRSIGVSVYDASEVELLLDNHIIPDVIQLPLNILSQWESGAISKFKSLGISIHARSIFLQGLLLCNPERLDPFFDSIKPWIAAFSDCFPTARSKVRALIYGVLKQPAVDFIVLGAENSAQINDWFDSSDSMKEELPDLPDMIPETILNPNLWPRK